MSAIKSKKSVVQSFAPLWRRHQRRYAGFLVHFGVIIATIGITASMAHKTEREFALGMEESVDIGRYTLVLDKVATRDNANFQALYANVSVLEKGNEKPVTTLFPELRYYKKNSETTTEVALRKGLREDLYLVLAGLDDSRSKATFKVYINPLQGWLWLGVAIMAFGGLLLVLGTERVSVRQEDDSTALAGASAAGKAAS